MFGKTVSSLQSNVNVSNNAITGDLAYVTDYTEFSSKVAEQQGNYLALKFDIDPDADSVKVGLRPTYKTGVPVDDDSGLVEIKGDPDMNGVFRIVDVDTQDFIVLSTKGTKTLRQTFDLSGLELAEEE